MKETFQLSFKFHILFSILIILLHGCSKDDDPIYKATEATSAEFYKSSFSLVVGGREKMMVSTEPINANLSNAQWCSSDTSIAKVDSLGIVKACSVGEAVISVTTSNNISSECTVTVGESPILGLEMPSARYPIAENSQMLIIGTGFTENSKIYFRPHSDFKSVTDDDILAEITELSLYYINLYVALNPGWYDVVLEDNNIEFDLGNIEVETPILPEYTYDENKVFWDDTHWRRFQLRGEVRTMEIVESYYPYWSKSLNYSFNSNGLLKSMKTPLYYTNYEYDNFNRPKKKTETCRIGNNKGKVNFIESIYSYGNHELYISLDYDLYTKFSSSHYRTLYQGSGAVWCNTCDFSMFQKALTKIESQIQYESGLVEKKLFQFKVSNNQKNVSLENLNYSWEYTGEYPSELLTNSKIIEYKFSQKGKLLYEKENHIKTNHYLIHNYVEQCPFNIYSNCESDVYSQFVCHYDSSYNLLKLIRKYDTFDFYYTSYDHKGNWTQCTVKNSLNNSNETYIFRLTRNFTYWD